MNSRHGVAIKQICIRHLFCASYRSTCISEIHSEKSLPFRASLSRERNKTISKDYKYVYIRRQYSKGRTEQVRGLRGRYQGADTKGQGRPH